MHLPAPPYRIPASGRWLARAGILLAAWMTALPAAATLVVMHGLAEPAAATLWIQTDAPTAVKVRWRAAGEAVDRELQLRTEKVDDHVVVARLTGLAPGAAAPYRVQAGRDRRDGVARAQASWASRDAAAELTIAIGSCFFATDPEAKSSRRDYGGGFEIFDSIAAKRPDLMLWLGDNVYLQPDDLVDSAAIAERYRRQRAFPPLQALLTATMHLAIWDDHDYGPNNSNASYPLKNETLKLFQRYWPNPDFGLPGVPGTFGVARLGDLMFFLLDDRYYRAPNRTPDGPARTMFGARQLDWLKQALAAAPRDSIKIIAGGSQFWKRDSRFEGWHRFAAERGAFAEWLIAQRIEGVLFVSGDRHFSELLKIERPGAYPLLEFTSSPLTSRPVERLDGTDRDNPDVVPGTQIARRQFGLIRVTGPGDARRLSLESYDGTGALLWRHEVRAIDLRFPAAQEARR
jgi:alkaline phosphatase D